MNEFFSINKFFEEYEREAKQNSGKIVNFALVRGEDRIYVHKTVIAKGLPNTEKYLEKLMKSLLYIVGCSKVLVDDRYACDTLSGIFSQTGIRAFDYKFFTKVFGAPLCFEYTSDIPEGCWTAPKVGGKTQGKRIGFDAGGSDIKVCAVKDGSAVFSEEIVWLPKLNSDPDYHYGYIRSAIEKAYKILGGADSLGVSTAGVVADNEVKVASLFIKVPEELFVEKVKNIYKRVAEELNLSLVVANDGDVAAYEGALELQTEKLLGIALGTSEAGGYVDKERNINGWMNELAFVPIDVDANAVIDEWSGDAGCGAKYLSQDAAIRLAEQEGLPVDSAATLAEKLKIIQKYAENGDKKALRIFDKIGVYLGEAITFYNKFYDIKSVMLLGRVTSGKGGEILVERAREILKINNIDNKLVIPDEHTRRLGQAYAAALL